MKINLWVTDYDCDDCKKILKFLGKTKEECNDRVIKHCYDHDYPAWRQPGSDTISFEEYRKIFLGVWNEIISQKVS